MNQRDMQAHIAAIRSCKLCPSMVGPPVHGCVSETKVIVVGQAPGPHEEAKGGRPFSHTAGKRLFQWFESIGLEEEFFRSKVAISAVCRCFPGKAKGGDRVPSRVEIETCSRYLEFEFRYYQPTLVIPVGRLAINQFVKSSRLEEVCGRSFESQKYGVSFDLVPLPHPSGRSTWLNDQANLALVEKGLALIAGHSAIKELRGNP